MIKKKVLICTPSHDGKVQVTYTLGCLDLLRNNKVKKGHKEYTFDWFFTEFSSDIMKARNEMFWNWFYTTEHDYLLFIDSDEGFTFETVKKLLDHTADFEISCAPVPLKKISSNKILEWVGLEFQNNESPTINVSDMLPASYEYNYSGDKILDKDRFNYVEKMGTGFMLIPRKVVQILIDYYDTNPCEELPIYLDKRSNKKVYSFFSHKVENDRMLGEDYSFCARVRKAGIPIKVDTSLNVSHHGTFAWEGNVQAKKRHQILREKLTENITLKTTEK